MKVFLLFINITMTPVILLVLLCSLNHFTFFSGGDLFFVEYEEASLPVWMWGNKESCVFVLCLQGGPEASGVLLSVSRNMSIPEEQYVVVYWNPKNIIVLDHSVDKVDDIDQEYLFQKIIDFIDIYREK